MPLSDLTPTNLETERQKFFAQDYRRYNPQFTYSKSIDPQSLRKYGEPIPSVFEHSQKMLAISPPAKKELVTVSEELCTTAVQQVIAKTGLPPVAISFSEEYLSGFAFDATGLRIKTPVRLYKHELHGKLNHELQTHYLRRANGAITGLRTNNSILCKFTEEGLAGLHSFIEDPQPIMTKTYLNYVGMHLATTESFASIFETLMQYGVDSERAWIQTVKNKRGITDTSKGGGSTLAKTYLEGAVRVSNWIAHNNPKLLFLGRLGIEEIEQLPAEITQAQWSDLYLPSFFRSLEEYRAQIKRVADYNRFSELLEL